MIAQVKSKLSVFSMAGFTGWSISVLFALILSACATTSDPGFTPLSYSEAEYAPFIGRGTASLRGQAFLKTKGGDVKKGAGNEIYLMPATDFGRQRVREEFVGGRGSAGPAGWHGGSL